MEPFSFPLPLFSSSFAWPLSIPLATSSVLLPSPPLMLLHDHQTPPTPPPQQQSSSTPAIPAISIAGPLDLPGPVFPLAALSPSPCLAMGPWPCFGNRTIVNEF